MRIWGPICVLICFVAIAGYYWKRLIEEKAAYNRRWFITWASKGLGFPILLWVLLNIGHAPIMPALIKVRVASASTPPPTNFVTYATPATSGTKNYVGPAGYVAIQSGALVAISSFWAALTLGWFVVLHGRRLEKEERGVFITGSGIWCGLTLPIGLWLVWAYGLGGVSFMLLLWFWPILQYTSVQKLEVKPAPRYTKAVVNLKFGKYAEAEAAIIQELEKFENDFDGWLMLAELYAKQFNDLEEAERTIYELCNDPATTVSQMAIGLHKLADWQLQFRSDPVAARRALDEIIARMPGTHLARMAQLRLRQLPANRAELAEQQGGKKFKMPALSEDFDATDVENIPEAKPEEAVALANRCVEKLERDPKDVEAREKLARIFAERLGETQLALEQLELLIEMPGQPAGKMAEWIGLMAAWQIKYMGDRIAAQKLLQRLIREFPQSVQAFAAQRRLKLLEMETQVRDGA